MAFRQGNQGYSLWSDCFRYGVAAISYYPLDKKDLSQLKPGTPINLWRKLSATQKSSLYKVAYEMKKGDVIYVKEGTMIAGKGIVQGRYQFRLKKKILDTDKYLWPHQVPVSWEPDFPSFQLLLGAEQHTVLKLTSEHIEKLNIAISSTVTKNKEIESLEGEMIIRTARFRRRNSALIEEKKRSSKGFCESCGMSSSKQYYLHGKDCLQVHHKNPLAEREGATVTRLDDLVLICPNCHAVVHAFLPALTMQKLMAKIR